MSNNEPILLHVENLSVEFQTRSGKLRALENVNFDLRRGEMLAVVGESGSGKSVTSYAIMGILDPAARVTSGRILLNGRDILRETEGNLRSMRGRSFSMIFQNPRTALNPIRPIGKQIADVLVEHTGLGRRAAMIRAVELLAQVKIPDPERRAKAYPFELSGGMCQRAMIAMALSCKPAILIADEPTTGLDVTTQATILELIDEVARDQGMSTLFITHDLALAADHAQRIAVMHAGHVVEVASSAALLEAPRHPYTKALLAAMPGPAASLLDLSSIPNNLPDLRRTDLPECRYAERCTRREADCDLPLVLEPLDSRHFIACHHPL
ncbi:MAG TPA: ABC transporter ATP-binding protein [Afipia sp.]